MFSRRWRRRTCAYCGAAVTGERYDVQFRRFYRRRTFHPGCIDLRHTPYHRVTVTGAPTPLYFVNPFD